MKHVPSDYGADAVPLSYMPEKNHSLVVLLLLLLWID